MAYTFALVDINTLETFRDTKRATKAEGFPQDGTAVFTVQVPQPAETARYLVHVAAFNGTHHSPPHRPQLAMSDGTRLHHLSGTQESTRAAETDWLVERLRSFERTENLHAEDDKSPPKRSN